jgi:hypothetical protein
MQQGFAPSLKVHVPDEFQVLAESIPGEIFQVSVLPHLFQNRARTDRALARATTRDLDL